MQPIQPPKSIYGSLMGNTFVTEQTEAPDFGVQQKADWGEHIYNAINSGFEMSINFIDNMSKTELKRQTHLLEEREKAAKAAEKAREDQVAASIIGGMFPDAVDPISGTTLESKDLTEEDIKKLIDSMGPMKALMFIHQFKNSWRTSP